MVINWEKFAKYRILYLSLQQMQADYNYQVAKADSKIKHHLLEIRKIAAAF